MEEEIAKAPMTYLSDTETSELADLPEECRKPMQYSLPFFYSFDRQHLATFNVTLSDVAIGMISGRKEYFEATHKGILAYAARGLLIKASGKCPCSFRAAFKVLRETHRHAKWYYVGDEDAMINLTALVSMLSQFNSSVPTLVSTNGGHEICETCGSCPSVKDQFWQMSTRAFFGGTGQIFSASLVEELLPTLGRQCEEAVWPRLEGLGDLENTCHVASLWQNHWRFVRLEKNRTIWPHMRTGMPNFLVAHHVCPENIPHLAHANKHLEVFHEELVSTDNGDNDGCPREHQHP